MRDAHADAHADPDGSRLDALDTAHQAKPFIHVDERHIVIRLALRMDRRDRIDSAEAGGDVPLQVGLTGAWRDQTWEEHRRAVLRTLESQFAPGQMGHV